MEEERSIISALKIDSNASNQSSWCPICMEDFDKTVPEVAAHMIRCGHLVHRACLQSSLRAGCYSCAICRQPLGEPSGWAVAPPLRRYANMLRSGLVGAAVRQRMIADRISLQEIDAFFTGGASLALQEDEKPPLDRTGTMAQFEKMLRVGMDERAVRRKMLASGFQQHEVDMFFAT